MTIFLTEPPFFFSLHLQQKRQNELAAESAKLRNSNTNSGANNTSYSASGNDDNVIMDHSGMQDAVNGEFVLYCLC